MNQWGWSQRELEAFKEGVLTGWGRRPSVLSALDTYTGALPPSDETLEKWYRQWKQDSNKEVTR